MKTLPHIKNAALTLGFVMLLSGCQSVPPIKTAAPLDNAGFMTAWGAYLHCQAGTDDVDTMRADMKQLSRVASAQESAQNLPFSLPDFVKRVMAKPTSRLAADPNAMAAACALSAGQAALRVERMDVAAEMFRAVLQNHREPEYAYYVEQARVGMEEIARGVQAAAHAAVPTLIPISSTAFTLRNSTPVSFED
ncbi:MAG: hypothetical protein HY444_00890 [Nitrospirae bacterium]|nr:hypothetical protein [Nitrospirota bacterium]